MKSIYNFLSYKVNTNEIIRPDELEKISKNIIDELCLNEYVNNTIITDFTRYGIASNCFAFYDGINIYYDYLKTYYLIINTLPSYIPKNEITNYINNRLISILLHEIHHALQKRKVLIEPENFESLILKYSYEKKQKLVNEQRYNSQFYNVNPMERQARVKVIKELLNYNKSNESVTNLLKSSLKKQLKNGYDRSNPMENNPCNTFFEQNINFIEDSNDLTYEKKLELGLPVKTI